MKKVSKNLQKKFYSILIFAFIMSIPISIAYGSICYYDDKKYSEGSIVKERVCSCTDDNCKWVPVRGS